MAARRLLIIMLVLLGISTLAAALVDTRSFREEGTGSTIASETEQTVPPATVPRGSPLEPVVVEVKGERVTVVRVEVGDQLPLAVSARKADLVEIPALGLLEPIAPGAPARFDLLAQEPTSYGLRLVNADRVVARIEISRARKKQKKKAQS